MDRKNGEQERQLYKVGVVALLICGIMVYMYSLHIVPKFLITCVIHDVTGIYCPGCGGTRAVKALLHGHFIQSLWYHPLVLYSAVIFTGFMGSQTLARLHVGRIKGWRFHNWYFGVAAGIIGVNWVLKNILLLCFGIAMK